MNREHHRWYSPSLNRDMELLVFGHAGARVIVFPTSKGKFYEWEDRGMMNSLRHQIDQGWLQLYCVDSVDHESWYNYGAHPGARAWRHHQYFMYIYHEVLPLSVHKNSNPFLMTMGASFGAFHAMSFGLKFAEKVDRILALSGLFDIRSFTDGYGGDMVYDYNPMQFIQNEWQIERLNALRHVDIIMAAGKDDRLVEQSRNMSSVLWGKGIGNAMREWDGWSHDWQYWERMMHMYLNGHD
ncbi:MAG: alpha/beta hydrolase-fold protein [Phototrophicales bacterium]|nr:alpha/beta hydrolase-fold protein [Phototrophicales bacterium]